MLYGIHACSEALQNPERRIHAIYVTDRLWNGDRRNKIPGMRHALEESGRINDMPEAFDLLLSDIGMPEMDGLGLVSKIRASEIPEIAKLNAVALTAYAYTSDRVKALKAGFNNYVSKPVDGEELLTILEMYLPETSH
jgi:CheY-like chemotaxis protein